MAFNYFDWHLLHIFHSQDFTRPPYQDSYQNTSVYEGNSPSHLLCAAFEIAVRRGNDGSLDKIYSKFIPMLKYNKQFMQVRGRKEQQDHLRVKLISSVAFCTQQKKQADILNTWL